MTTKRFIEITAKSIDEAQELAKRELKEGEIIAGSEVLQAPTRGIFGVVGNPETRVRFTCEMRPPAPAPAPAPRPAPEPRAARPAPRADARGDRRPPAPEQEPETVDEMDDLDDLDELPPDEDIDGDEAGYQAPAPAQDEKPGVDVSLDPLWEKIQSVLQEVAENVGVSDVTFRTYSKDGNSVVEASGGNVSQLIGKHGRTLDSLQYVLNIILNKGRDDRTKLVLDVQGYREKRLKNLVMLANRMYRKVIDGGRQVELEPMSTLDRRTVHLALKDRAGVETYSRGIEPLRRVVISPKKPSGGYRNRPDRGGRGPDRDDRSKADDSQTKSKSVPMFLEEDGSNEG